MSGYYSLIGYVCITISNGCYFSSVLPECLFGYFIYSFCFSLLLLFFCYFNFLSLTVIFRACPFWIPIYYNSCCLISFISSSLTLQDSYAINPILYQKLFVLSIAQWTNELLEWILHWIVAKSSFTLYLIYNLNIIIFDASLCPSPLTGFHFECVIWLGRCNESIFIGDGAFFLNFGFEFGQFLFLSLWGLLQF